MSGHEVRDPRGRWAQVDKVNSPRHGHRSALPSASEMAAALRAGATRASLAGRYGVHESTIGGHLSQAGWNSGTGERTGWTPTRAVPLTAMGDGPGSSRGHVGGGDNPGVLPRGRVVYSRRPARPSGIIWTTPAAASAGGCAAAGVPAPNDRGRLYRLDPRAKLDADQRTVIAARYLDGESSTVLGRDYDVNPSTIVHALRQLGVEIRSLSEAALARHRGAAA